MTARRLHADAGIAIGPILFVLALLGVLSSILASGMGGSFGRAGNADRITADIVGQANLIRSKIHECRMVRELSDAVYDTGCSDTYPCSDGSEGTLVEALTCPNDPPASDGKAQSLWTGLRLASLPPPTQGFAKWRYYNGGTSGRCFWTQPTTGRSNQAAVEGLARAAQKFTSQELSYDAAGGTQKFVVIVTPASSGMLAGACQP